MLAPSEQTSSLSIKSSRLIQEIPLSSIIHTSQDLHSVLSTQDISAFITDLEKEERTFPNIIVERKDSEYQIVFGTKFFLAANLSGRETIPALILHTEHQNHDFQQMLREQFQWEALDDIEKAQAYQWLIDTYNYTNQTLASFLGLSRPVITNQMRLLQLSTKLQILLKKNVLQKSHCLTLLQLPSLQEQELWAQKIQDENLSVRALHQAIRPIKKPRVPNIVEYSIHHETVESGYVQIRFDSEKERQELIQWLEKNNVIKKES